MYTKRIFVGQVSENDAKPWYDAPSNTDNSSSIRIGSINAFEIYIRRDSHHFELP
ncbi:MAG TPA: hypothetical protein V6D17_07145 [Candidatus Obscuribacterales bacterium]